MLNVSFPSIAFGDSSKTYPTYGIPVPDMGMLGEFKKAIKRIIITPPADGYKYAWDKTVRAGAPYGTIRIYEAPTAGTLAFSANLHDATLTIAAPGANVHAAGLTMEAATGNVANLAVDANTALHSGVLTMQAATGNLANRVVDVAAPTGNLANKVVDITATGLAGVGALVEISGAPAATVLDLMVIGE
jgi:hypothetical protein